MDNHEFMSQWDEVDEQIDGGERSIHVMIETPDGKLHPVSEVFYRESERTYHGVIVIKSDG